MSNKKRIAYLILFFLLPFSAFGFSVHLAFFSRFIGHEEITRQAIILTELVMKKKGVDLSDELLDQMTRTKKMPWGVESVLTGTRNPIVIGNYAADKPDQVEWIDRYSTDIYERNGFPKDEATGNGKNMLKYGAARSFHFTLNEYQTDATLDPMTAVATMVGETQTDNVFYQSGTQACQDAQSYILSYSNWAMEALAQRAEILADSRNNRKAREELLSSALFRIGVATHVIQDSFSPSHTFRSPEGGEVSTNPAVPEYKNHNIIDVCYYDQEVTHASGTVKEWRENLFQQESRDDELSEEDKVVIKPELRLAESRKQVAPCAHGKFDKNDNVWLSTDVQIDILKIQQWNKWEREIWEAKGFKADSAAVKDSEEDLQRFCNHNRFKSSDFSSFKCLKHEARLARTATLKYFLVLLDHVNQYKAAGRETELASAESKTRLANALKANFFEGSDAKYSELGLNEIMPLGTMRCGDIKTPVYRTENKRFVSRAPQAEAESAESLDPQLNSF